MWFRKKQKEEIVINTVTILCKNCGRFIPILGTTINNDTVKRSCMCKQPEADFEYRKQIIYR